MSIQIKLKNSVVQDSTPSASDLPEVGELAVNGNINSIGGFMRASDNTIVKIFGPGSVTTPTATTTVSGISELATNSETTTGTATNRVVTPAGLNAVTVAERTTSNTNYVAKAGSTLTGVLTMPNGSNSAPAINFGDSDSGIFGGTNTVSLAAGGTTRLTADTGVSVVGTLAVNGAITSTSDLTIADKIIHSGDTNTAIRFPSADTVSVETGGSEAVRVDSSQRLLVGTSSARAIAGSGLRLLEIEGTDGASGISLTRNSADNAQPKLSFGKTRSASNGGVIVVQDNDKLGEINFAGADGTDVISQAASITAEVDGTPGANDMPGRLVFSTTADGAASPTERLRIDSAGTSTFTGNIATTGDITLTNTQPKIVFNDSNNNPDYQIENVQGVFKIRDNTNSADRLVVNTDGHIDIPGNLDVGAGLDVTGAITGTGDMTIDTNTLHVDSSNNRVGIGTASPVKSFHNALDTTLITGTAPQIRLNGNANDGSDNDRAIFGLATSNSHFFSSSSAGDAILRTTATGKLLFGTGTAEHMRLDSAGRLLIGTTTAGHADLDDLTIATSGNTGITIRSGTSSNGILGFADGTSGNAQYMGFIQYAHSNNAMSFNTNDAERMRIDSSGRVGIGTTSPDFPLETVFTNNNSSSFSTSLAMGSGANADLYALHLQNLGTGNCESGLLFSAGNTQFGQWSVNCLKTGAFVGDLAFRTRTGSATSAERMRIDSSGRLLLGTTTEGTATADDLTIATTGNTGITIRSGTSSNGNIFFSDATSGTGETAGYIQYDHSSDYMRFGTGTNERVRINSSGQVGISTTSPQAKLNIVDTANDGAISQLLKLGNNSSGAGTGAGLQLGAGLGNAGNSVLLSGFYDGTGTSFTIQTCNTFNGAQSEKFRITNDGKVGINIAGSDNTTPVRNLDIADSSGAILRLISTDDSLSAGDRVGAIEFFTDDDDAAHVSSFISAVADPSDAFGRRGALRFGTRADSGNGTEKMRITSSGSVGIGTTSPSAKLSVVGDSGITIEATTNATPGKLTIIGKNNSGQVSAITRIESEPESSSNAATTTTFNNRDSSNNVNEHMRITSAGHIRAGVTSAIQSEKYSWFRQESDGNTLAYFHQAASANVSGIIMRHGRGLSGFAGKMISFCRNDGTEVGSVTVGVSSTAFNTSSDYRLKENVTPISDGITRLKTLKPYRFNFKDDTTKPVVDGFFAHEVTAVPEAVTGTKDEVDADNNPVYQSIDQSKLVPLLVAAVQELIGRVEKLETA